MMVTTNFKLRFAALALFVLAVCAFLLYQAPFSHPSRTTRLGKHGGDTAGAALKGHAIAPKLGNATVKAELGRAAWKVLHTTFARFPEKPTEDEKEALRSYVHLFQRLYPCGECAEHFGQILAKYPPQVSSRTAAAMWGCLIHNKVNARLKKEIFDCKNIGTNRGHMKRLWQVSAWGKVQGSELLFLEGCGDVLTKKKLDAHVRQCSQGASFSCLDCMTHFPGTSYRAHTSCISEDQKYQGKLYKEKKPKAQHQKNDSAHHNGSQALTAHNAYAQDAAEADSAGAVALVDAPPRAPTPPPAPRSLGYHAQAAIEHVNVFDFLEGTCTPSVPRAPAPTHESRMLEDSKPPAYEQNYPPPVTDVMKFQLADDNDTFAHTGFSYRGEPVRPSREQYDSYTTPAPKAKHSTTKSRDTDVETTSKKTDRKRKRNSPAELDMTLVRAQVERENMLAEAPPMLHSGLTGGLNRLLARPEFPPSPEDSGEYANSPLSPMKRAKQGNSTALMRAQRDWELQHQKTRKTDTKEQRERDEKEKKDRKAKERGRERDRKERHASGTLVKVRSKNKRDDSGKEIRRIRRRHYSSSVSPAPEQRKVLKAIEHRPSGSGSGSADGNDQLIVRPSGELAAASTVSDPRADLFMSFINKGPESERGVSINKALKRYHRERHDNKDRRPSKTDEEKELWKNLRLKRNDRGEIVLFFSPPETS
ncbi:hypothetical protein ACEQ8H_000141 [Pleosporales sp. CAS-2024a]